MVVRGMRADPEPGDLVIIDKPKGAVLRAHTSGVDRIAMVNLLELKARVAGVRGKADTPFEQLP